MFTGRLRSEIPTALVRIVATGLLVACKGRLHPRVLFHKSICHQSVRFNEYPGFGLVSSFMNTHFFIFPHVFNGKVFLY